MVFLFLRIIFSLILSFQFFGCPIKQDLIPPKNIVDEPRLVMSPQETKSVFNIIQDTPSESSKKVQEVDEKKTQNHNQQQILPSSTLKNLDIAIREKKREYYKKTMVVQSNLLDVSVRMLQKLGETHFASEGGRNSVDRVKRFLIRLQGIISILEKPEDINLFSQQIAIKANLATLKQEIQSSILIIEEMDSQSSDVYKLNDFVQSLLSIKVNIESLENLL